MKLKKKKKIQSKKQTFVKSKNKTTLRIAIDEIKIVDINKVHLDPDNPRLNDKKVNELAKGIIKYGQRSPIVVHAKTKIILKGNTTWKAMVKAGFTKIAVIYSKFDNIKESTGYALFDNKSSEWTTWDDKKLASLILSRFEDDAPEELEKYTGFKETELKVISKDLRFETIDNKLPDYNLKGNVEGLNDSVIIMFDNPDDYETFREEFSLAKRTKSIKFSRVLEKMDWR